MADRPTKEFTTPLSHVVVFFTYLTGREAETVKDALASQMKMIPSGEIGVKPSMSEVPASFVMEQEKRTLQSLLVSVDGNTENPLELLLDLPSSELDAVKKEVNETINPSKPTE